MSTSLVSKNSLMRSLLTLMALFFLQIIYSKNVKDSITYSGSQVYIGAVYNFSPFVPSTTYVDKLSHQFVRLKIDDFTGPYHWYTYTIEFIITPQGGVPYNHSMTLENQRYGGFGNFIDFELHEIPILNDYGFSLEIVNIHLLNNETGQDEYITPTNVSLSLLFEAERYFELLPNTQINLNHASPHNNELYMYWGSVVGAEEYELEWTWIDNYSSASLSAYLNENEITLSERDFQLNNTRIQTKNTYYRIPLIYSKGFLVYRVRAVGRSLYPIEAPTFTNVYSDWSVIPGPDSNISNPVSAWTNSYYRITESNQHEMKKNWQFQSSYAEDGKKKDVISYFDGSLRNRQTVTKSNTANKIIVGEVIYDEEGRPAIEVLPIPSNEFKLFYHKNFNRNAGGLPYGFQDFSSEASCAVLATSMSVTNGASKYYSSTYDYLTETDYHRFVPNANGYPFSQIEYTTDNTGRVKRKGGVGETHQLGSGHEMKYFYSTPTQEELNRLFGYNVGFSSHYKKNIVSDPNKQLSISYIDPHGRTIATALLSEHAENMIELDDEKSTILHQTISSDLLNKLTVGAVDTPLDNNQTFKTENSFNNLTDGLEYVKQHSLLKATNYTFNYSFSKSNPFVYACNAFNYSYPFVYDLTIKVMDDCKTVIQNYTYEPTTEPYSYDANGNITFTAPNPLTATHQFSVIPVETATYGVEKKLSVNQEALDAFAEDYIKKGLASGCIFTPFDVEANLDGCESTCTLCKQYYNTLTYTNELDEVFTGKNAYVQQMLASNFDLKLLVSGSPEYQALLNELTSYYSDEFDDHLAQCDLPCNINGYVTGSATSLTSIECSNKLTQLLDDVSPSGQYGHLQPTIDADGTVTITSTQNTVDYLTLPISLYNDNSNSTSLNRMFSVVEGINPEQINWRNPHYYNYNGTVTTSDLKHYFTLNGVIDYVTITKVSENTFSPPVTNPLLAELIEETTYKIEPQYLANVNDFITFMQSRPSWNLSLVKYHPEFHYLDYTLKSCGVLKENTLINSDGQTTTITCNSDGFDAFLATYDTFDKAHIALLLLTTTSIRELDPFFVNEHPLDGKRVKLIGSTGNYTVGIEDPVGTNQQPQEYRDFKQEFFDAAFSNYEQSGKTLAYVAYNTTFCDGISNNCFPSTPSITPLSTLAEIVSAVASSTADESDKDLFWQTYMSMYFTLKQKLKSLFLNVYGYRQGFYNECIGNNNSESTNKITSIIKEYPTYRNTISSNYINSGLINGTNNTLKAKSGAYLKEFSKRFIPFDVLYDSQKSASDLYDELSSAANSYYYASTGQCLMVRDLEMFLNGIKSKTHFDAYIQGDQVLISSYPMPFLTPDLFASLGGNYDSVDISNNTYQISSSLSSDYKELTLTFTQGGNTFNIVLKITGSNDKTWNGYKNLWSISNFKNTAFTSYDSTIGAGVYRFATVAQTQSIQNPEELFEILIEGYSKAILQCSPSDGDTENPDGSVSIGVGQYAGLGCTKKKDFTIALNELILHLKNINQIEPTATDGYDLVNDPVFMNGYLYEYFAINDDITYIKWDHFTAGTDFYQLKIGTSSVTQHVRISIQGVDLNQNSIALWIGSLNSLQNGHTFHVLNYGTLPFDFLNVSLQSGTIQEQNFALEFACCRDYGTNNDITELGDYFEVTKNAYNEVIEFVMYHVTNNFELPTTFSSSVIQQLSNFYNNSEDFGIYNLSIDFTNSSPSSNGTYSINFDHGTAYTGFECIVPVQIKSNIPFKDIDGNYNYIDSVINNDNIGYYVSEAYLLANNTVNTGYLDDLEAMTPLLSYFNFVMSNGYYDQNSGVQRNGCLKTISDLPQCPCIPQVLTPVDCDSKYLAYVAHLDNYGLDFPVTIEEMSDRDIFCGLNLHYSYDKYIVYLNAFGITSANYTTKSSYIDLTEFAGTNLNGNSAIFDTIIADYYNYLFNFVSETYPGDEETPYDSGGINEYTTEPLEWKTFVNNYLLEHPEICPPAPLFPALQIPNPTSNPCENSNININLAYNQAAYLEYINQIKTNFKTEYLEKAIGEITETFTMTYFDKEYQYTLYYYDQAGNLIQTVAPEGVQRLTTGLDPSINQFRSYPVEDDTALLPNHTFKTQYQYNSLNQLVWQSTPDGGETRFAYDLLGRIVASQNANQSTIIDESGMELILSTGIKKDGENSYIKSIKDFNWYGANTSKYFIHRRNIFVSYTIEDNLRDREIILGLTYFNHPDETYIDFAFYINEYGHLFCRNGQNDIYIANSVANGSVLELHRTNAKVNMYVNNVLVYQFTEFSGDISNNMLLDFAMRKYNAKISNLTMASYGSATKFSYTRYDELGRIFEAGEFTTPVDVPLTIDSNGVLNFFITNQAVPVDASANIYYPYNVSSGRNEVTRTYYDDYEPYNSPLSNPSNNTRNRVTSILTFPTGIEILEIDATTGIITFDQTPYETGIFYNYDIHGNVDEMVQSVSNSILDSQDGYTIKRVNYEYDLISGNVNKVYYQKNQPDQFIHKYNYDADNRIVSVETSNNNLVWEKDASYKYYNHGPLARVELGDKKVQGIDYAYTLQGWLKNVNSESLANKLNDIGGDGNHVSKDAFGYSLSYFNDDYSARHQWSNQANSVSTNSTFQGVELFNGNINRMITSLRGTGGDLLLPTQVNRYRYDQLNRIFSMDSFSGNTTYNSSYSTSYSYDKNGNLTTLNRTAPKGGVIVPMDELEYHYINGTNKLTQVIDEPTIATNFTEDIDSQIPNNYTYDAIGQLKADAAEGIININWRVDGKVKSILKNNDQILFFYDGLGNRIAKKSNNNTSQGGTKTTHYSRDAQGNTMAVYNQLITPIGDPEYKLGEHHIYGSSRLGLQDYRNDGSNTDDMRRIVGDKRYELSNHLGNVLSVINDRKIVDQHMELAHSEFFDNEPWQSNDGLSATYINQDYQLEVMTQAPLSGCSSNFFYIQNPGTYNIQVTVNRDLIPEYINLYLIVLSINNEEVLAIPITESKTVIENFMVYNPDEYRIVIVTDENNSEFVQFTVDNFYLYTLPNVTNDFVTLFKPDVLAFNDYYPFGMLVPNRHGSSESYRYGFQGQEKDDEVKGEGNSLNYTFRMHDARVGRFFSRDPLEPKYPELTPYQFSSNTPIMAIELEGLETGFGMRMDNYYGSSTYLKQTSAERREVAIANGVAAIIGLTTLIDIYITKGWLTKSTIAYSYGEAMHSAQMQTYYRDQGNEFRAQQYQQEGAEATKALVLEGVLFASSKMIGKVIGATTKMKATSSINTDELSLSFSIKQNNKTVNVGETNLNNGVLELDLNVPVELQGKGIGKSMFDQSIGFFGKNIKKVQGLWTDGTNLDMYNKLRRAGKSKEDAAFGTVTGKWAKENGFDKVEIIQDLKMKSGDSGSVKVYFSKSSN